MFFQDVKEVLGNTVINIKPTVNVLLSGPERSGKTTIALLMKQVLEVQMCEIDIEEFFKGGPLKSPVKKLQEEITKINEHAPGILLIHKVSEC